MSHTKGPWRLTIGSFTSGRDVFVVDDYGDCIAIMDTRGGLADYEEKLANARLIAAAPELYEACKAALYEVQDTEIHMMLDAALAKAGG